MFIQRKILVRLLKGCVFFLCFFFFSSVVYAADATLFLSPVTGTATIGDTFSAQVMVSSGSSTLNAVEGKLSFDPEELEVTDATTTESTLTSWTTPPSIDNQKGEIVWSGMIPRGGSGNRLPLFRLTMKGHRVGQVQLHFSTGAAVLAADGSGTNVLTSMNGGIYVIIPKETLPTTPGGENLSSSSPSVVEEAHGEVLGVATGTTHITSLTHPDPDHWYKERTATVSWDLPSDIVAVYTSFDKKPEGRPSREYRPPIKEKMIKDIDDGIWYFHLLREYTNGETDIEHRRVAVDTISPSGFSVNEVARDDATDPTVTFLVTATDTLSGVDHFTFALDSASPVSWIDDGMHHYSLTQVSAGQHTLHATACDAAGNATSTEATFSVEALPVPELHLTRTQVKEGQQLVFQGKAIPHGTVQVFIARGEEDPSIEEVAADADGSFALGSALRLSPGVYEYWGKVKNSHGAVSATSEHQTVVVEGTVMGLIKRHPLIPFAFLGLIALLVGTVIILRRVRQVHIDHHAEEDSPQSRVTPQESLQKKSEAPVVAGGVVRLSAFKREL